MQTIPAASDAFIAIAAGLPATALAITGVLFWLRVGSPAGESRQAMQPVPIDDSERSALTLELVHPKDTVARRRRKYLAEQSKRR